MKHMKIEVHAAIGGGFIGVFMAGIGFPFLTWQFWAILLPCIAWYLTKPLPDSPAPDRQA